MGGAGALSARLESRSKPIELGDLWDVTEVAVRLLRKLGVGAGDRVALVAENGLQIVPLLLAVSEMDAWAVPFERPDVRAGNRDHPIVRWLSEGLVLRRRLPVGGRARRG